MKKHKLVLTTCMEPLDMTNKKDGETLPSQHGARHARSWDFRRSPSHRADCCKASLGLLLLFALGINCRGSSHDVKPWARDPGRLGLQLVPFIFNSWSLFPFQTCSIIYHSILPFLNYFIHPRVGCFYKEESPFVCKIKL